MLLGKNPLSTFALLLGLVAASTIFCTVTVSSNVTLADDAVQEADNAEEQATEEATDDAEERSEKPADEDADERDADEGDAEENGDDEESDGNRSLAQRWLDRVRNFGQPKESQKNHSKVMAAFESVVAPISESTAVVYSGDEAKALAAIVSTEGHVVTKASEFGDNAQVELHDGRRLDAKLLGIHEDHDLAMLKIDADGLKPVDFSQHSTPPLGSFLITSGIDQTPVAVGVVSAISRKINQTPGVLGIQLAEGDGGAKVELVMPKSGALKAGVKKGDVVLSVNGERTKTREELIRTVRTFKPGETVRLKIQRGDQELVLNATLGARFTGPGTGRGDFQNALGGTLSKRRTGFAKVIQHDTVLSAAECGGPVVDLDGKLVGLNIARAGRVASFLLPAELVSIAVEELKSGKFAVKDDAPNIAFQIAELELQIEQTQEELDQVESRASQAQSQFELANEAFKKAQAARNAAKKESDMLNGEREKLEQAINELKQQRLKLESQ